MALALAGGGIVYAAFTGGNAKTSASPSPTPPATKSSPSPPATGDVACGGKVPPAAGNVKRFNEKYSEPPAMTIDQSKVYVATMRTSCGTIEIELDPRDAPNTVNSIVFLAKQHFYDGTFFHRIVPDFVIQGGDPTGTGKGGPGYTVVDEPPKNAQYPLGTMAMAKTATDPAGTAGSQFFIVTAASAQAALAPGGEGQYAIAGHVVGGHDVVRKIAAVPVAGPNGDTPQKKVYIEKVSITEGK